jgi:hypothetical protein
MKKDNAPKMIMLNTRIPSDLHKRVKLLCVERDMTIQQFVYQALREKYKKEASKK